MPDDSTTPLGPDSQPKPPLGALFDLGFHSGPKKLITWEPPSVEELQQALTAYEVTAFVARGGMGAVYKGVQKALNRTVAIKVLPPEIEQGDVDYAVRFKREAQAMAQLSHPGIVAVHDAGEPPSGFLYFVMELIEGSDVAQLLAREGKLDPARALKITVDVLDALAFAHESGIIHRDIKPSNIMLDARGRVKVADFGLAKVITQDDAGFTRSDLALGTADFIAPEALIPGTKVDARADVYAVGVMLYQMITGKIPRGSFDPPSDVIEQLDPRIDAIVLKAMKTDREKRYASAAEMRAAIEALEQRSVGTPARTDPANDATAQKDDAPTKADPTGQKQPRRAPFVMGTAAAFVLGISAFLFLKSQPVSEAEALKLAGVSRETDSPAVSTPGSASLFASGQWVKVWSTPESIPNAGPITDGWATTKPGHLSARFTSFSAQNGGIRARLRRAPEGVPPAQLLVHTTGGASYNILPAYDAIIFRQNVPGVRSGNVEIKKVPLTLPAPGQEYRLAFFVIGQQLIADLDGKVVSAQLPAGMHADLRSGVSLFQTDTNAFRDVEVLNLDGLPEAEALKLAGVTRAPVWKRVDFDTLDDARLLGADPGFAMEGNLLHLKKNRVFAAPSTIVRNGAVRAVLVWSKDASWTPRMTTRMAAGKQYHLTVNYGSADLDFYSGSPKTLRTFRFATPLREGDEVSVQLASIGQRHFAWLNGTLLGSVEDGQFDGAGELGIQANDARFKSMEWLPLDGLPEAEALKLVGAPTPSATIPAQPAAKWIAVDFARDLLNENNGDQPEIRGGQLHVDRMKMVSIRSKVFHNAALRVSFVWRENTEIIKLNTGFKQGALDRLHCATLNVARSGGQYWQIGHYPGTNVSLNGTNTVTPTLKPGDAVVFQFATIGDRHFAWLNGKLLGSVTHPAAPEGGQLSVNSAEVLIDRYEYLDLDGLPEAEALKAVGVSTPAPAEGASASAPYPLPGPDGKVRYPAGTWARMLSREVEAHGLADPDTRQDGAWLRWNNPAYGGPSTQLNVLITPITDLGMRVRFRGQRVKDEEYPQFILRKGPDNASPNLFIRDGKLQIRFTKSGYPVLAEASLIEPLPAGKEYIAEFYAIGQQLIARVNGQTLTAHLDLPPEAGSFTIYGASWDYFKDAEVINLDGFPEAEALKLVGLDAAASAPSQR